MSFWDSEKCNFINTQNSQECNKILTKVDLMGKLHIIHALDTGQKKSEIAREFSVQPQTVSFIYNQKESILKKYKQKVNLLTEVRSSNLEKHLLDWISHETTIGNAIIEDELKDRAYDIMKSRSENLDGLDEWLLHFRLKHNIVKYIPDIECNKDLKEEWKNFLNTLEVNNLYIGGMCPLLYSLDVNTYANGETKDNYVSVLFFMDSLGYDKKKLTITGKDIEDADVESLPLYYYYSENSQLNYSIIMDYLQKWNKDLKLKGKTAILAMNIPDDFIRKSHFSNINLINPNYIFFSRILEKIMECFKYHYRKLHITKMINCRNSSQLTLLDYLQMISLAWYNVPSQYIKRLFHPPPEGSLYKCSEEECTQENHSLTKWWKQSNIPINLDINSHLLNKYINCDQHLTYLTTQFTNDTKRKEVLLSKNSKRNSGIEAYQAIRRLLSYLQGENVEESVIKSAKHLENRLEYEALLEIHENITESHELK